MKMSDSILKHVRASVGLEEDNEEFDTELTNHINLSIGKLNQNGVGNPLIINDDKAMWSDLLEPDVKGFESVGMIPTFMALNVKLLFDPPPPSSVEFHTRSVDEILWRMRLAYEKEVQDE